MTRPCLESARPKEGFSCTSRSRFIGNPISIQNFRNEKRRTGLSGIFYQEVEDVHFRIDVVNRFGMSLLNVTFKYRNVMAVFRRCDLFKCGGIGEVVVKGFTEVRSK